jgi:hypothetical protein
MCASAVSTASAGPFEHRRRRKHRCSFLDRPDIAAESKARQVLVEKCGWHALETREASDVRDVIGAEVQLLQVRERLLETRRDQKRSIRRQVAHVQLERGR